MAREKLHGVNDGEKMPREGFFALLFLFAIPVFATHVAVLETIAPQEVLTLEEKQYLTDVLRSEAVKALPAEQNFVIMTRENINVMLPPGKSIEDCEGSCLVETGKNIAADYVAQGHVGRFADNLTITVELYETAGNKLLGSFSSKATNIENLELQIHQKSSELFSKIVANSYGKLEFHLCVVGESCYILWNEVPHESSVIRKFLFDPCACKDGVKVDLTKEFVDPREKRMQEIRRMLFSLMPPEQKS